MESDMQAARGTPHRYAADILGTTRTPPCTICGQTRSYRAHQSLLWRLFNPGKNWR